MKKLLSLIKIDFNNTFGLSSLKYNFKRKKDRWQIVVFGLAALSLIPSYFMLVAGLGRVYDAYKIIDQKSYFLQLGILLAMSLAFLLGIIYVMSKYYFSNDLNLLVPLPIRPSEILGSKFITLIFSEYLTSFPIILPFIFIYGLRGGEGFLYWIYALLIILFLPVIPLILASILIMIFMKYTNIKGKKDRLRIVVAFLFLILMIFGQISLQKLIGRAIGGGTEFYLNLAKDSNLLVKKLGLIFPPSMWASLSLANYSNISGFLYLILFISLSLLGYRLMIYLSEKIFFQGLIGNIEESTGRKKLGEARFKKSLYKKNKPYIALAKKELIMLFKTPVYLLNSMVGALIVPLIILISVFTGDESSKVAIDFLKLDAHYLILASIGLLVFQGIMNSVGSTSFSREGKSFWIQRVLPIRVKDQIIGRILASLVPQLISFIALYIALYILLKIKALHMLLIGAIALIGSIFMAELGMFIDITRPLLIWDNPQKAMKQNLNVLISMSLGSLYIGGLGYLIFKNMDRLRINHIYFLLVLIFTFSSIIFYLLLKVLIRKQFSQLE